MMGWPDIVPSGREGFYWIRLARLDRRGVVDRAMLTLAYVKGAVVALLVAIVVLVAFTAAAHFAGWTDTDFLGGWFSCTGYWVARDQWKERHP